MTYEEAYLAPAMAELGNDLPDDGAEEGQYLPHYVYAISDERSPERPFYIGVTNNPVQRANAHFYSPNSAVYTHTRYLDYLGIHCNLTTLARFRSRRDAEQFETFLIATTPNLFNRDIDQCKNRFIAEARVTRIRTDEPDA